MTSPTTSSSVGIEVAVRRMRGGGVIALPTDTLYALVAPAGDAAAVRRVFAIKGRGAEKALPLFVSGLAMAERVAIFNAAARRLAQRFWPGAVTLVLPKQPSFDSEALAGGETVALRVPDQPLVLAVIEALGGPVTATSANRSGGAEPATAADVERQLGGEVDLILDGGACAGGVASTVVDCSVEPPRVLRAGAVSEREISDALG